MVLIRILNQDSGKGRFKSPVIDMCAMY